MMRKKIIVGILVVIISLISVWWIWEKNYYSDEKCSNLEKEISDDLALLSTFCEYDSDCKPLIFHGNWVSFCVNKNEDAQAIESSVQRFLDHCFYIGVAPTDIECSCENNKCIPSRIQ
jgi:hypothetical protein